MIINKDKDKPQSLSYQTEAFKTYFQYNKYYYDLCTSIAFSDKPVFELNYEDLITYNDNELLTFFENDYDRALKSLKKAVSETMIELADIDHTNKNNPKHLSIRLKNYGIATSIRKISVKHNKKIVKLNCAISKISESKPYLTDAIFRCEKCDKTIRSPKTQIPEQCAFCNEKDKMILDMEQSTFTPLRMAVIQDLPEDLPPGEMPISKSVRILGEDLTESDLCRAGSRIKLDAMVKLDYDKTTMEELKGNTDTLGILDSASTGATFSLRLEAQNIESLGEDEKTRINSKDKITKKDMEKIKSIKEKYNNPDLLMHYLTNSFAQHIYGHNYIREVLLLVSVGAHMKMAVKKRGDINFLCVGNAGVAKSQLLIALAQISPRSIYVSGRGSSAVGLTAAVVKDEKTGQMMLEAGATVLADQGLIEIDEFDKLKPDDRSALHEVMEQQTCSIAKGGIVATLNARVSVVAAANPLSGTYDSYKTLAENTGYPPSMLSRFDFVFAMKDVVDETNDTAIARTIIEGKADMTDTAYLDPTSLAKYIQYIKNLPDPTMSQEAKDTIEAIYVSLRKRSEIEKDGTVAAMTVTARLVDTLKRASIARARILQKETVDKADVNRILFLLSKMYESFGVLIPNAEDPDLNENVEQMQTINLGLLYGKPLSKMNKQKIFLEVVDAISMSGTIDLDIATLEKELMATKKFITSHDVEEIVSKAVKAGVLRHRKGNIYAYDKEAIPKG